MNSATLSGAIDVIVVEQPDGTMLSTPFHVRFGKYGVFNYDDKYVDIQINNEDIDLKMKLGGNGVAFFVEKSSSELSEPLNKRLPQQQRQKTILPYSSSIFSCRKYRSLPDLSILSKEYNQNDIISSNTSTRIMIPKEGENGKKKSKHRRKATFCTTDMHNMLNGNDVNNFSTSFSKTPSPDFQTKNNKKEEIKQSTDSPESSTKTNYCSSDEDEENKLDDKNSQKNNSSIQPIASPVSDIADGALSDPEVDRQGISPHMNDPEWKWGEIPKSSKTKDSNRSAVKKNEKQGGWNWFRWSRQTQQVDVEKEETTDGNQLTKNNTFEKIEEKQEGKGLYLQDLVNDPAKLEKYFGTKSGARSISSNASNFDSGKGVSLGTSPCSALSINEDADTATTTTITDVINKPELNKAQSLENLTVIAENIIDNTSSTSICETKIGRSRFDSGTSDVSCATDLNLSDEEFFGEKASKKSKRSLRLSSDQLKLLNLCYGSNDARFSITTKFQGTAWCSCHIYLLRWDDKLVISDIDGTITKSDVLGHVLPAIGGTWAHSGVAELYTRIKNNGYQMVYLSSRAIGQSHYTKTYLQSVAQGSQTLPDGPVLLSPTSVLMAFKKEVIERRPEEFKIACLNDLKSLFPVDRRPFFAGFGNRETDVKSYKAVDIPLERIFIIDPYGTLRRADKIGYVSNYVNIAISTVDYIFPPITLFTDSSLECSEFKTWRCNPKHFDYLVDKELEEYEKKKNSCIIKKMK